MPHSAFHITVFLFNGILDSIGMKNPIFVNNFSDFCFCAFDEKYKNKIKSVLKKLFFEF